MFTLGHATKEVLDLIKSNQKKLSEFKSEAQERKAALESLKEQKTQEDKAFKELAWTSIYKKYEVDFKEGLRGCLQKESFSQNLINEFEVNTSETLDIEVLREKAKTIFHEKPIELPTIPNINADILFPIEDDEIWAKNIVGKSDVDISKLIQELNIDDWVNQGRNYIHENDICPFCQKKTISDEFKIQLENYFDNSYAKSIDRLKKQTSAHESIINKVSRELQRHKLLDSEKSQQAIFHTGIWYGQSNSDII